MAIRLFFEYEKLVVQLPVNPEEITISSSGNNKTEEIISLGEINILRDIKLQTCKIKCFLPQNSNAPYVLTSGNFEEPQYYIDFFNKIREAKDYCRFLISDTEINFPVAIESFEYGLKAGSDDIEYTLTLKEYKPYAVKTAKKISISTTSTSTPKAAVTTSDTRAKTGFAIGDTVIANGKYWYTSYGDSPYGTFNNFKGKISHIVNDKSRKYRYHITTTSGGYRGWVDETQISHTS